jgi:hypothetical protein
LLHPQLSWRAVFAGSAIALASANTTHPPANKHHHAPDLRVRQILFGAALSHTFVPVGSATPRTDPLTGPDDITALGHYLFVAFQNGVGSQGEATSDGNTFSTIVEFTGNGTVIRQWDIKGKCDGLTADQYRRELIATVNEDADSSIYTVALHGPSATQIVHYAYNKPLPHFGGTDAISVDRGALLVSASAPGTTGAAAPQPAYPAVYSVRFDRRTRIASVHAVLYDEASARVANVGTTNGTVVRLALTDPDSNAIVPHSAARFGGDFEVTSQADMQQIYLSRHGRDGLRLSVLNLSQSVDDTAWMRRDGRLYGSDSSADTVNVVTGDFPRDGVIVAVTPCDAGNAPSTCPGPGFPPDYLGWLNPWTGTITAVTYAGPNFQPKGLVSR